MTLSPGQILNNRYRIVMLLGQGGFGAVYRAWDINMECPRALKENLDTSPEAQRQFKREAQILGTLSHPNLPHVIDHFITPGQGQYLVMDFVEGQDLQEMLNNRGGPLPEAQLFIWISQVCDALSYLHSQNPPIIHRDIKPANIKITPGSKAMLVDFGVAKVYDPRLRTTMGARAVTPGYSPNEQYISSGLTDARTDIYALGATLYTLVTGQVPAEAPERNMGKALPVPRTLNPAISPSVDVAILRAMEMLPKNRFQSAVAFKAALAGQAIPEKTTAPVLHSKMVSGSIAMPTSVITPRLLPWGWIAIIVGLLALVVMLMGVVVGTLAVKGKGEPAVVALSTTVEGLSTQSVPVDSTPTPTNTSIPTGTDTPIPTHTDTPVPTVTPAQITDGHGVIMALVPAGEFRMGGDADAAFAECQKIRSDCKREWFTDQEPIHVVYLDAFYMDIYEVTNALYARCVQAGVCSEPIGGKGSDNRKSYYDILQYANYPVVNITWEQAYQFCRWRGGKLPSEAQWEKAARGGLEGKLYPWGDEAPDCTRANFIGKDSGCIGDTNKVGSYPPNGYGLYDMAGNVYDWVMDWYSETYYAGSPGENPPGPTSGDFRVLRGGSYYDFRYGLLVTYRRPLDPSGKYGGMFGLRCSRSP
jgi:serine/threonine protein kinase